MKKFLCMLIAMALLLCAACAETAAPSPAPAGTAAAESTAAGAAPEETAVPEQSAGGPATLGFEDGFVLELPAGWQYYSVNADMAAHGVLYCLSDAEAQCWLYIQSWNTDCADIDALKGLIDRTAAPQTSGVYTFNGTDFVIYDLVEGDVSCCAALLDGRVLNFVFTPQSDAAFMATATQIISSFGVLAQ